MLTGIRSSASSVTAVLTPKLVALNMEKKTFVAPLPKRPRTEADSNVGLSQPSNAPKIVNDSFSSHEGKECEAFDSGRDLLRTQPIQVQSDSKRPIRRVYCK